LGAVGAVVAVVFVGNVHGFVVGAVWSRVVYVRVVVSGGLTIAPRIMPSSLPPSRLE
jgi:hypothetical protein